MNEFEERLAKAVERGRDRAEEKQREEREKALSEEELKTLHSRYRLAFSEHIETGIRRLPEHFPGFQVETLYGEKGWGASASRDDFGGQSGTGRNSLYSRMEMTIRPFSHLQVVELAAKATIRNKGIFSRTHFRKISDVDEAEYLKRIDAWIVEFAERFAASG